MIHQAMIGQMDHFKPRINPEIKPYTDTIPGFKRFPVYPGDPHIRPPLSSGYHDNMPVMPLRPGGEILVMKPDSAVHYSLLIKKPFHYRHPYGPPPHILIDSFAIKNRKEGTSEKDSGSLKDLKSGNPVVK